MKKEGRRDENERCPVFQEKLPKTGACFAESEEIVLRESCVVLRCSLCAESRSTANASQSAPGTTPPEKLRVYTISDLGRLEVVTDILFNSLVSRFFWS